jgi:hypothetical protein
MLRLNEIYLEAVQATLSGHLDTSMLRIYTKFYFSKKCSASEVN